MCCQQVAHSVHVAAEIFLPESLVVGRRIGIQIDNIAVLQLSCDIIYYPDKAFLAAILPGHGDKEKFCIRLDGLQPLDDFCIPAGEGASIACVILQINICFRISHLPAVEGLQIALSLQIVNAQCDNLGLFGILRMERLIDILNRA